MSEGTHETLKRVDVVVAHLHPIIADAAATINAAAEGDFVCAYLAWEHVISSAAGCAAAYRKRFDKPSASDEEYIALVLERVAASLRGERGEL